MAIVAYNDVAKIKRFTDARAIRYPILSDPKSEIIRAFGLLNEAYPPGSFAHGVPYPIIFVIDAEGVVRHRFSEDSYRDRPEIDLVLDAVKKASR